MGKGGNREKEMDGGKRSRKYGKGEKETRKENNVFYTHQAKVAHTATSAINST